MSSRQKGAPDLRVVDFPGVVMLKDWYRHWDGRQYIGVCGQVSILDGSTAGGFEVRDRDSSWFARVQGPGMSLNILDCQVRLVCDGQPSARDADDCLDLR